MSPHVYQGESVLKIRRGSNLAKTLFLALALVLISTDTTAVAQECPEDVVLFRFDSDDQDQAVTLCDLYFYLLKRTNFVLPKDKLAKPGAIHDYLQNIALTQILASEKRQSIEPSAAFLQWSGDDELNRQLMTSAIAASIDAKLQTVDYDLLASEYYSAHIDEFQVPQMPVVSHILVDVDDRSYQDALEIALRLRQELMDGADFGMIAKRESDDESAKMNAGRLGAIKKGTTYPTFEKAAYSLAEIGEVSEPVFSIFGIHLIRLDDTKASETLAFESVKSSIVTRLRAESRDKFRADFITELKASMPPTLEVPEPQIYELLSELLD